MTQRHTGLRIAAIVPCHNEEIWAVSSFVDDLFVDQAAIAA